MGKKVEKVAPSKDKVFVEPWTRDDGVKYITIGREHPRAAGSTKPPRVSRVAIPEGDWATFVEVVNSYKK